MTKQAVEQIKVMCTGEIEFCEVDKNAVIVLLPYDNKKIEILIEGNNTTEQVNSFVCEVNNILDEMINHLEDVKLSYIDY
jgi:hypothetical protein